MSGVFSMNAGAANAPQWKKFTVTHLTSGVKVGATDATVSIYNLTTSSEALLAAAIKHSAVWTGGALSSVLIAIVDSDNNEIVPQVEGHDPVAATTFQKMVADDWRPCFQNGNSSIKVQFAATGANLTALTAGSVDVWLLVCPMQAVTA